jgi:hypothetical protein
LKTKTQINVTRALALPTSSASAAASAAAFVAAAAAAARTLRRVFGSVLLGLCTLSTTGTGTKERRKQGMKSECLIAKGKANDDIDESKCD